MAFGIIILIILPIIGLTCSITGLVLSCSGQKQKRTGFGLAGFVISLISTILNGLILVLLILEL